MSAKKFYVTTPIYYVNAKPHIGHLYSTLLADIMARWNKLQGKQTFFLTGLDEHGQKIAQAAEAAGMNPQAFVDAMAPKFYAVWQRYQIEYTKFLRTTDAEHQHAVKLFIQTLLDNKQIYKANYSGPYCTPCETFVSPQEAKEHSTAGGAILCTSCGRQTKQISEESYFFKLSAYQDRLLEFYAANPNFIQPKERLNEVVSFIKTGLKDLSFSRKTVSWGIPFPGDSEHTVYVWGDALTNYISGVGYGKNTEEFAAWWPADLHIMAKDILRFHAVYWPAMLMAANLACPRRQLVHGHILVDNKKMSKSIGNVVDPNTLADWYGAEPVRYYLARTVPTTQDGTFSLAELEECVRADLANNLGNLLSRTVSLALKHNLSFVKTCTLTTLDHNCQELLSGLAGELPKIVATMEQNLIHTALGDICKQLSLANAFFHQMEPWKLAKTDMPKFAQVIWSVLSLVKVCATLLWPIIPNKAEQLLNSLGHKLTLGNDLIAGLTKTLEQHAFQLTALAEPLFEKPAEHSSEFTQAENPAPETNITGIPQAEYAELADFLKVKMAVGKILSAENVAGSNKLLKLLVDFGVLGTRQVVSGIAEHYTAESLVNTAAVFAINLRPRKIMGLESQAMLLTAINIDKGSLALLTPEKILEPGSSIC